MRITVFTSTYNRAHLIVRLYESLRNQSFKDFEWIVINDGSTDNTDCLIKNWMKESPFSIQYLKVDNGGKHRAINKGLDIAKGILFYIVDSDDFLPQDALENIDKIEKTILSMDRKHYCGVCGLKGLMSDKTAIGNTFSNSKYLDITMLQRKKYNISGDKAEVFYTNLLKQYKFPEFYNENFITECVVWDKIAHEGFKMRFFNTIIYLCEYLDDGLTANSNKLFKSNPQGYGLYIHQSIKYKKINGYNKWAIINKFVIDNSNKYSKKEIAKILHMSLLHMNIDTIVYKLFRYTSKIFGGLKK